MEPSTDKKTTMHGLPLITAPLQVSQMANGILLIADSKVGRQSEKRGALYQAVKTGSEE